MSVDLAPRLLNPATGEVLPATPENAARRISELRALRDRLLEAIRECEAILVEDACVRGTKTLRYGEVTARVAGGSVVEWDVELLRSGLRAAGCPEDRLDDLIRETVEYRVNASVVKQLAAANPRYAKAIAAARTDAAAPWRVGVSCR